MPTFSRAQLGTVLLLGTLLFLAYGWRENLGSFLSATPRAVVNPVFLEIAGNVTRPGIYSFSAPPTLLEVWRLAGGPEPRPQSDLTLPPTGRLTVTENGSYCVENMPGDLRLTLGLALDLNTATAEDLEALPGVGPTLAQRIVQHRQSLGPFRQVEDLLAVYGIGAKKLAQIRPLVTVSAPEK